MACSLSVGGRAGGRTGKLRLLRRQPLVSRWSAFTAIACRDQFSQRMWIDRAARCCGASIVACRSGMFGQLGCRAIFPRDYRATVDPNNTASRHPSVAPRRTGGLRPVLPHGRSCALAKGIVVAFDQPVASRVARPSRVVSGLLGASGRDDIRTDPRGHRASALTQAKDIPHA